MTEPLWQWDELIAAAGARAEGTPVHPVTGFSIDTRTLRSGDVFVALKADRDGHVFVPAAFAAGAAAALVSNDYVRGTSDGPVLRVADPLAALEAIGNAARTRSSARIVAVTGSVGKTGSKEMLRLCLSDAGATHASEKSYNNHWGVPLTLARMPASAQYGVFEIGMNHAGEITPLTRLVRPHVTVITTVEPVHLGHFGSVEAIAEAKAEIFAGLVPGGTAVLPRDNPHFPLLAARASAVGARIVSFGYAEAADVRCIQAGMDARADFPRRVAVLGDMLELGAAGDDLHRALKQPVDAAGIDLVFACGPMMRLLFDDLKSSQQAAWAADSAQLAPRLLEAIAAGDVIMIKGSLGSRMGPLAEAVRIRFSKAGI